MNKMEKISKAAQMLGRRGGMKTLKTHGAATMREWGKLGAKFGKLGGRPRKPLDEISEAGRYQRMRRARQKKQGGK